MPPDPNQGELFETIELYRLSDEIMGMALKSRLADAGLDATIQVMRASFYGSALDPAGGYWGKLLVAKDQEVPARKILAAFLKEFEGC
jgi:hypothetical protein